MLERFMHAHKSMLSVLVLSLLGAVPALAGQRVGNGDELKIVFAKAKDHASHVLRKVPLRALAALTDDERAWVAENRDALAADVIGSPHEWVADQLAFCAETANQVGSRAAPITLSLPTCAQRTTSFDQAGELLVHESIHHLGVGDENFADRIAIAVYRAWRTGATEWLATNVSGAPQDRVGHSAVWTGQEMVVFGGVIDQATNRATNSAYGYDPASDTWRQIASTGAPTVYGQQAVWTGSDMLVWGGFVDRNGRRYWQNAGYLWNASAGWRALPAAPGPRELLDDYAGVNDGRALQTLVWTGTEAIVYGGELQRGLLAGGVWNPASGWREIRSNGAPLRAFGHTAVWNGSRMLVWGGALAGAGGMRQLTNAGAAYNPVDNTWEDLPPTEAKAREGHTAIWTGAEMIVFGGWEATSADVSGEVAVFVPTEDGVGRGAWRVQRAESVAIRDGHSAVWTGSEMLVFGGRFVGVRFRTHFNAVSAFNPESMAWRVVESKSAPYDRAKHSAVWTGSSMIVFGGLLETGSTRGPLTSTGGVFYP